MLSFSLTLETIKSRVKSLLLLEELPHTCKVQPLQKPL